LHCLRLLEPLLFLPFHRLVVGVVDYYMACFYRMEQTGLTYIFLFVKYSHILTERVIAVKFLVFIDGAVKRFAELPL